MSLHDITDELVTSLTPLRFSKPVTHVYNPLVYARASHDDYINKYGQGTKEVLLFGMNPGPWGMSQNGIPFGEISLVRDWLGIEGDIHKPNNEHPKRPIEGWNCQRSEVSGTRLWGWIKERFTTPDSFFERFFIANYCPLAFMEESGRNRTPDKLKSKERDKLFPICDNALLHIVQTLQPTHVVGIGNFAYQRALKALDGLDCKIGKIFHPSPANPKANKGWVPIIEAEFAAMGIDLPQTSD